MNKIIALLLTTLGLWLTLFNSSFANHGTADKHTCIEADTRCAKTISATVDNSGRIWLTWSVEQYLYVNYSDDRGRTLSPPVKVNRIPEEISARGENRPKIALDKAGNIYLSWVMTLPKKWTANIRFSWSEDNGQTFSQPTTINDDQRITSHSFNEMLVSDGGQVHITWLDGRRALASKDQGKDYTGSAIYLSSFNPSSFHVNNQDTSALKLPQNIHVVDGSCVCCRLAMSFSEKDLPIIMWRHIFGDNYRDHALLAMDTANKAGTLHRVSFENWQIDGCPHHGPALLRQPRAQHQRLHMSWFNDAPNASGLFYAYTDNTGASTSNTLHIAKSSTNPAHPSLALTPNGALQLAWQEFDGEQHIVKLIRSHDGEQWSGAIRVSQNSNATDYPFLLSHPDGNLLLWHQRGKPLQLIEIQK